MAFVGVKERNNDIHQVAHKDPQPERKNNGKACNSRSNGEMLRRPEVIYLGQVDQRIQVTVSGAC